MTLLQALSAGFVAKDIIQFLINRFPGLKTKIEHAQQNGYSLEQILSFLNDIEPKKLEKLAKGISVAGIFGSKITPKNQYSQAGESDNPLMVGELAAERQRQVPGWMKTGAKAALGAGLGMAGSYALSRAMQSNPALGGLPAVQNAMGGSPGQTPAAGGQVPPTTATMPTVPPPNAPSGQPGATAQATGGGQPPVTPLTPPTTGLGQVISQLGMEEKVRTMLPTGNDAKAIAMAIEVSLTPEQRKWLKKQKIDLTAAVDDFIKTMPPEQATSSPATAATPTPPEQRNPVPTMENAGIKPDEATEAIAKRLGISTSDAKKLHDEYLSEIGAAGIKPNSVLLPSGDIGTVKEERNGIATVDVAGKEHHHKADDLIEPPLPPDEMADLYNDLVYNIPESERSSMFHIAGYDDNSKELLVVFPNGDGYVYQNVPKEFGEKLTKALFQAKTTGSNFYGAWAKDEPSRGAGISVMIKELQTKFGGKGKEYSRKFINIYDLFRLPKSAAKAKYGNKLAKLSSRQSKTSPVVEKQEEKVNEPTKTEVAAKPQRPKKKPDVQTRSVAPRPRKEKPKKQPKKGQWPLTNYLSTYELLDEVDQLLGL